MPIFKKISISTKIILPSVALAAIFLGSTFSYVVLQTQKQLETTVTKILEAEVIAESQTVVATTESARQSLLAMSQTPSIQEIIRSGKPGSHGKTTNSNYEQSLEFLDATFRAEAESKPLYDKIRYIDKLGNEIVRVDNIKGLAVSTEKGLLQNKSDRDYFQIASALPPGQVYVSRTELSREGNPPKISTPYRPVIRYASPISNSSTNENEGVLVISVNIDELVSRSVIADQASAGGKSYIINSSGEFILNPLPDKEWGGTNNLNTGISLDTEFPKLRDNLVGKTGSFKYGQSIFAYAKIQPDSADENREWIVMKEVPRDELFAPVVRIARNATIVAVLIFMAFFVVFAFGIRRVFSPLVMLADSAKRIASGDFSQKVKIRSNDEVGLIATEFNKMSEKLAESYSDLEKKVSERTSELQLINNVLVQKEEEATKQFNETLKMNKYMIDRELKMVELKKENQDLKNRISQ